MSPARHASDDRLDAATWCGHLVPAGSVYAFLADHRHELFPAKLFADVTRLGGGHPSVIATVMVLQALEGLCEADGSCSWPSAASTWPSSTRRSPPAS